MSKYSVGSQLPSATFETDAMTVITANIATADFFPGLIDPDYARAVGHDTVFMNTMALQTLMDRWVLDWAPEGRIAWHEIAMRKPAYAGLNLELSGQVAAVSRYAGSNLTGPGKQVEVELKITAAGEVRVVATVAVVIPD